jgi:hypothetical protein
VRKRGHPLQRRDFCRPGKVLAPRALIQALRLRQRGEGLERGVFDLPYPFAGDAEGSADLIERPRLIAIEAEAQLDDAALALGQRGDFGKPVKASISGPCVQ